MYNKTIFLAMPVWESIFPETMFNIFYQDMPEWYELIFDMNSLVIWQPIQHARNLLTERFLQWWYDYLWFCDADNPPSIDVLKKLIEADKDIVSAIVPLRCWDKETNLLNIFYEDERWSRVNYSDITKEKEQVIEVANCWTGCVLIKREVAETVFRAYEWHPFEFIYMDYIYNKKKDKLELYRFQNIWPDQDDYVMDDHWEPLKKKLLWSEDVCFFERAKEYGFKIYADLTAICYHFFKRPYKRQLVNKDLRHKKEEDDKTINNNSDL